MLPPLVLSASLLTTPTITGRIPLLPALPSRFSVPFLSHVLNYIICMYKEASQGHDQSPWLGALHIRTQRYVLSRILSLFWGR